MHLPRLSSLSHRLITLSIVMIILDCHASRLAAQDLAAGSPSAATSSALRDRHRDLHGKLREATNAVKQQLRDHIRGRGRGRTDGMQLRLDAQKAESDYMNAKLSRELSEISVKEYEEGIALQQRARLDGELKLYKQDITRGQQDIDDLKKLISKAQQVSTGSIAEIYAIHHLENDLRKAEQKANLTETEAKKAEANLDLFNQQEMPEQQKRHRAEVQIAILKEEIAKAKSEFASDQAKTVSSPSSLREAPPQLAPILPALAKAIALDSEIAAKLKPLETSNDGQSPDLKNLAGMLADLNTQVSEIELLLDDIAFAELERQITIDPNAAQANPK